MPKFNEIIGEHVNTRIGRSFAHNVITSLSHLKQFERKIIIDKVLESQLNNPYSHTLLYKAYYSELKFFSDHYVKRMHWTELVRSKNFNPWPLILALLLTTLYFLGNY
jgi:hypothetical protein